MALIEKRGEFSDPLPSLERERKLIELPVCRKRSRTVYTGAACASDAQSGVDLVRRSLY